MRPLERRTVTKRVKENRRTVRQEQRKPNLPGNWIVVGDFIALDDPGNDPPTVSWRSPPYENGYTYAGTPYDDPAFRHGLDGALEFKGHVDVSGATSGDTAWTLPASFRPPFDVSWTTDVSDGVTFFLARVSVDASTGAVAMIWPAT